MVSHNMHVGGIKNLEVDLIFILKATCRPIKFFHVETTKLYGFDTGTDPIILETVNCTGNEPNVSSCPISPLGQITNPVCHESNRTAGVGCTSKSGTCFDSSTRLVDGPTYFEGHLEVCRNNQWLAVCENGFNKSFATTTCGQLYLSGGEYRLCNNP